MQLLKIKQANSLLPSTDETTRSYLEVFTRGSRPPAKDFTLELSQPEWSLENDSLWAGHAGDYQAWVCRLAFALVIRTSDPILLVCSRMVSAVPCPQKLDMTYVRGVSDI